MSSDISSFHQRGPNDMTAMNQDMAGLAQLVTDLLNDARDRLPKTRQLATDRQRLLNENASLQSRLSTVRSELSKAATRNAELERSRVSSQREVQILNAAHDKIMNDFAELRKTIADEEATGTDNDLVHEKLVKTNMELQMRSSEMECEFQKLKDTLSSHHSKVDELRVQLADAQERVSLEKVKSEGILTQLRTLQATSSTTANTLPGDKTKGNGGSYFELWSGLRKRFDRLKHESDAQAKAHQSAFERLKMQNQQLEASRNELADKLKASELRCGELTDRITDKENDVQKLQSIQNENRVLKRQLAAKETELDEARAKIKSLAEQAKEFKSKTTSNSEESVKRQLEGVIARSTQINKQRVDAQRESLEYKAKWEEATKTSERLKLEKEELVKTRGQKEKEATSLRENIKLLRERARDLLVEKQNAIQELDKLKTELQSAKENSGRAQAGSDDPVSTAKNQEALKELAEMRRKITEANSSEKRTKVKVQFAEAQAAKLKGEVQKLTKLLNDHNVHIPKKTTAQQATTAKTNHTQPTGTKSLIPTHSKTSGFTAQGKESQIPSKATGIPFARTTNTPTATQKIPSDTRPTMTAAMQALEDLSLPTKASQVKGKKRQHTDNGDGASVSQPTNGTAAPLKNSAAPVSTGDAPNTKKRRLDPTNLQNAARAEAKATMPCSAKSATTIPQRANASANSNIPRSKETVAQVDASTLPVDEGGPPDTVIHLSDSEAYNMTQEDQDVVVVNGQHTSTDPSRASAESPEKVKKNFVFTPITFDVPKGAAATAAGSATSSNASIATEVSAPARTAGGRGRAQRGRGRP